MPDFTIAIAVLKKPIELALTAAADEIKDKLQKIKIDKNLKKIHQKLYSTQKVKTIWNTDRAISINSFYYPAKIEDSKGTRQQIISIDDFPTNANIIKGTAGQGKSIFLRWLLGKEIKSGSRIPLFIELRKISQTSLEEYLAKAFGDLFETSDAIDLFQHFSSEGRISILLDGYDEIDPEQVSKITAEIEELAAKYPVIIPFCMGLRSRNVMQPWPVAALV